MTIVRLALAVLVAAVTGGSVVRADEIPTEPAYLYRAVVVNIVDGDTIDADIDLGFYVWIKKQRIRLIGIDAPEPKGETRQAGLAAAEYLRSRIDGASIILRTVKGDDGGDRDDSFGRWLGTVYHDGVDVNAEMVRAGHAVLYQGR